MLFNSAFEIRVNERQIQLGEPLPDVIHYLNITCIGGISVPTTQVPDIKQWLNLLISRISSTTEFVTYNGVLIPIEDVKAF